MWAKILLFLVSVLCLAGCENSNQRSENGSESFGYELLVYEMEDLRSLVSKLVATLADKIDNLNAKIEASNSRLSKLETTGDSILAQQTLTENKISESVSELIHLNAKVEASNSSLQNRLANLETTGNEVLAKQRLTENRISESVSKLGSQSNSLDRLKSLGETIARDQKATDNRIVDITASVSTLKEQSKQILRYHFDLVLDSCSKANVPGVYRLQVPRINVLCESTFDGGGWFVIQERSNGGTNFYRGWYAHRTGFGTVSPYSDFWLGLEAIHQITSNGQYELRVDVQNESKELKYARYSQFKVAGESDGYRLTVGGYSGTAIDGLSAHNNQQFSTYDKDNDTHDNKNCALDFESGWWFSNCRNSNLNGPYSKGNLGFGIEWGMFTDAGTYSRMMIRRKS